MTSENIGEKLHSWFGAGQSIGWLIMAIIGIGVAHGMLRTDVARNRIEITKMDERMTYAITQLSLIRERQSGSGVDIGNIKEDIRDIKIDIKESRDGIDDLIKLLSKTPDPPLK